jgi:hypothetical protein
VSGVASIVRDLRHSIELLAQLDDPAATRTAEIIGRSRAGLAGFSRRCTGAWFESVSVTKQRGS